MKARLTIIVEGDRVVGLDVDPPLGAKVRATDCGPEIWIVTTAASLLEGDDLTIELFLSDNARLTVRSVAAQMAHACVGGGTTALNVRIHMGARAELTWRPEPLILCAQSNHRSRVDILLGHGSILWWSDELVLGRTNDDLDTITLDAQCTVQRGQVVVFDDGLHLHPREAESWQGPAVLGDARYLGTLLRFNDANDAIAANDAPAASPHQCGSTALAFGGTLTRIVAADPLLGRRQFSEA